MNSGTLNSIVIGGLCQTLSLLVDVRLATAVKMYSWSPWNFFILHMMADLSGSYLPLPAPVEKILTSAVLLGTGILMTTLFPMSEFS